MRYIVNTSEYVKLNLKNAEQTRSEEILQNIAVILNTPKGSVPMDKDFGLCMDFLDKPLPAAKALIVSAVTEAVREHEPRADVKEVSFTEKPNGQLVPAVEVEINE